MSYVDRSFSITDDDFEGTFIVHNRPPVKEIVLAVSLLSFGAVGIILGFLMLFGKFGGDRGHGTMPFKPIISHIIHVYRFIHWCDPLVFCINHHLFSLMIVSEVSLKLNVLFFFCDQLYS